MSIDLTKFKGALPYASELFAVYQPLIGWRSQRTKARVAAQRDQNLSKLISLMTEDVRLRSVVGTSHAPVAPDGPLPPLMPSWLNKAVSVQLEAALTGFRTENKRWPTDTEWEQVVGRVPLASTVQTLTSSLLPNGRRASGMDSTVVDKQTLTPQEVTAMNAIDIPGTHFAVTQTGREVAATQSIGTGVEAAVQTGLITYFSKNSPAMMVGLVQNTAAWEVFLTSVDPLAGFDPNTQDAVLSPLGMMQLFREYFFEFDSFLGPAVGHVWLSPGSSLELFETHTRKTIEQREVESRTQTISTSEKSSLAEDELASQVSRENSSSVSLGVTANAGVNFGVAQASASANFGYTSAQKSAQEEAHKHMRQQSEKISTELRTDVKTVFRTTVETQDTSSKRYVLQNSTDKLLNYELRRKMRQVGVQVQHLGAQLCWQAYVDRPGEALDIAELVHIAKRGDLTGQIPPPEAPPPFEPIDKDVDYDFPYQGDPDKMDKTYTGGVEISSGITVLPVGFLYSSDGDSIVSIRDYKVALPPGYELTNVVLRDAQGVGGDKPASPLAAEPSVLNPTTVRIHLTQVNFQKNPAIRVSVTLTFEATKQTKAAAEKEFQGKMDKYTAATQRAQHEEYINAVRERIKLASNITPRDPDGLRTEERTVIFQALIRDLLEGAGNETPHVTVELIRSIFDIDEMLYFVAESWWTPALRFNRPKIPPPARGSWGSVTAQDTVGWDGQDSPLRDKYYVTEDSSPAPTGASIGWLLQLDGDPHRNAFLNSPFVKAVIPIRPGREDAAIAWMERTVEGKDGLDAPYRGTEPEFKHTPPMTTRQVLTIVAQRVATDGTDVKNVLATETVFQNGFDPLEGGFKATDLPYQLFDQWIEVLPTDQIVAVDYKPPPLP
jgi:hypothetical protein